MLTWSGNVLAELQAKEKTISRIRAASPEAIGEGASILREGGLVAFPTETVYGLGANALDASAVARIFTAKGRPSTSPLIVHVDGVAMARALTADWPDTAAILAERYWPGPLTLVLPKTGSVPEAVSAGLLTIGVRVPGHPVALALIRAAGSPLAAPSANLFMQVSPTTAQHVADSLGDRVDLILDGGPTEVGIESTVLSLTHQGKPLLLRPGSINRRELEALLGPLELAEIGGTGAQPSPGMRQRHYSPSTPLQIGGNSAMDGCGYIWWSRPQPSASITLHLPDSPDGYARALYAALHDLDRQQLAAIIVEPVPENVEWDGVRDRLKRAANQK